VRSAQAERGVPEAPVEPLLSSTASTEEELLGLSVLLPEYFAITG
jgi:hypothetical protein